MEKVRGKAIYELFAKVKMNHNALKKKKNKREKNMAHFLWRKQSMNCKGKVKGKAIYKLFAKVKMNHNALKIKKRENKKTSFRFEMTILN